MSFRRTSEGLYLAPGLGGIPGIEHFFGTRHVQPAATMRTLKQVHSALVHHASDSCDTTEGDALYTAEPGVWIAVKTADCVPILIAARDGRAVAAVHAGWRGTAAGIATQAVNALTQRFGLRPADLYVAIGPSIGPCCYDVGPEVVAQFSAEFIAGRFLDLWAANRRNLLDAGVPASQIEVAGLCTRCQEDEFQSWRRDGPRAGRMYSGIRIAPK